MTSAARRSHPAYASSTFEVTGEHANTLTAQTGFRTVESGIKCSGIGSDLAAEHPILLTSFSGIGVGLSVGEMYGLKCKIIAPNVPRPPHFIHEMSHHIHIGNAETFPGNLIDNTAISSTGVITEKRTEQEARNGGKPTIVSIIRHTDWDPMTSCNVEFNIDYWCRPVRNLIKTQNLFQRGREVTINGFITGFDRSRHILQVDIMSISVCTGPENINSSNSGAGTAQSRTTRGGRVRLPRATASEPHAPNSSPLPSTSTTPSVPSSDDNYLAQILAMTEEPNLSALGPHGTERANSRPPPDNQFTPSTKSKRPRQ